MTGSAEKAIAIAMRTLFSSESEWVDFDLIAVFAGVSSDEAVAHSCVVDVYGIDVIDFDSERIRYRLAKR